MTALSLSVKALTLQVIHLPRMLLIVTEAIWDIDDDSPLAHNPNMPSVFLHSCLVFDLLSLLRSHS